MDEGALPALAPPQVKASRPCQLVRRGDAAAVVSAGSTAGSWPPRGSAGGRCPACSGRARRRAADPSGPHGADRCGATADPKPEMLVQFGQLGVAYVS